jgi:hypothetical protein
LTETDEQPTAEHALAARLQLEVAIQQLVTPAVQQLDRSRRETDPAVADTEAAAARTHHEQMTALRARYVHALRRRDDLATRRTLATLVACESNYKRQRAARAAASATIPSLLDQLHAAVESSQGVGISAGVHRSPIGLNAAELLGHIQRTVGHRPDGPQPLTERLQHWARETARRADAAELLEQATLAERWVVDARAIVQPDRGFEIRGACPLCGTRYVWVQDGDERVQKAALQVSYATRSARCIARGCTGHWAPEYLEHLTRVVVQDRDERAG